MKQRMLCVIGFAMFVGSALHAQNIVGIWQGTLQASKELRLVFKITKADNAGLAGTLYSIDQGAAVPIGAISSRAGAVKIEIPGIGATYEGKLSADGITLTGDWIQQGGNRLPLILKHATTETAWTIPATSAALTAMPADAKPVFEVATIKPADPSQDEKGYKLRGRTFSMTNYSVGDMIAFAYDLQAKQITAGPAWIDTEKYDIAAQQDMDGLPSIGQLKAMLQKLLADRFSLTTHNDKKDLSVYVLSVAKSGPKMTKDESDKTGLMGMSFSGPGTVNIHNGTMNDFARMTLQGIVLDRPVLDRTGLTGRYDFTLSWTPDASQFGGKAANLPPPADAATAPPGLFTAIQEQIGLKLNATKAPADVLVIDHVDKPSVN
jgi:uncharacterized protein (TIGR03435 family)